MYTVYIRKNCFVCTQAITALTNAKLPFTVKPVTSETEIERLIRSFPMFDCDTCLDGIALPIVVKGFEVVGGYLELLNEISTVKG